MPTAHCVECDEEIELETRPRLGQKVTCANCGAALEVVGTNPLELDWAEEDESEAWDEELDEELDEESDAYDEAFLDEEELEDEESDTLEDEEDFELEDDYSDDDFDEYSDDDDDHRWN